MKLQKYIAFIILFISVYAYGQDTLYFDLNCKKVNSRELAKYYELVIRDSVFTIGQEINYFDKDGKDLKSLDMAESYSIVLHELGFPDRKIERVFRLNGKLKIEKQLIDVPNEKAEKGDKKFITKLNGKYKEWYPNGVLRENIDYKKGVFDGDLLVYWDNNQLKRQDSYKNAKLISGKCFTNDGKEIDYFPFEQMPEFPGGEKALLDFVNRHLIYPVDAQRFGIQGKVIIRFVVEKTGYIGRVEVARGVSPDLDSEAIRVVKSLPRFKPGMQDGELVSVWYTLPLTFRLL